MHILIGDREHLGSRYNLSCKIWREKRFVYSWHTKQIHEKWKFQNVHDMAINSMKQSICVTKPNQWKIQKLKMSTTRPRRAIFVAVLWLSRISSSKSTLFKCNTFTAIIWILIIKVKLVKMNGRLSKFSDVSYLIVPSINFICLGHVVDPSTNVPLKIRGCSFEHCFERKTLFL